MTRLTLVLGLVIVIVGCAVAPTPDMVRQRCLEHGSPRPFTTGEQAQRVFSGVLTAGITETVNQNRMVTSCSEILGDENVSESCPAWKTLCEQFFAERRNAAGATRVSVQQNTIQKNY